MRSAKKKCYSHARVRGLLAGIRPNRKYKDALFRFIFKDREKLLDLYNALNSSHYCNADDLQIVTDENVIYMQMKEDVSFLVADTLNLYEHQSTWNPNMPVRGFLYLAMRYDAIIHEQDLDIYGSKRVVLPTPRFVVFYNGEMEMEEREELRLSDSFAIRDERPALEVTATVLNINYNHNKELLAQCKPLQDYAAFVEKIREYQRAGIFFESAMKEAIDYCISHDILTDILQKSREEVTRMVLTEYNPKKHIQNEKKLSKEEGQKKEQERGIRILITTCKSFGISREKTQKVVAEKYQITEAIAGEKVNRYWEEEKYRA